MDSPLQKAPLGLLQALNLQTLGLAPIAFSDRLVPVWDATTEYMRDLIEVRQIAAIWSAGTGGVLANQLVEGQGEYLLGMSALVSLNGADGSEPCFMALQIQQAGGVLRLATALTEPYFNGSAVTAVTARALTWWAPRPYLLRPTEAMQVFTSLQPVGTVLANVTAVEFSALVARLR